MFPEHDGREGMSVTELVALILLVVAVAAAVTTMTLCYPPARGAATTSSVGANRLR